MITSLISIALAMTSGNAPETRRSDFTETLHGQVVADPYRWLEDINSPETKDWVKAQSAYTRSYLDKLPHREEIKKQLENIWEFDRYGSFLRTGGRLFFTYFDGKRNQPVWMVQDGEAGKPRLLLDPNTLSKDGTVAVGAQSFSKNGKYMAYSVSRGGSDWQEWYVRDVDTGKDTADKIEWSKFSGADWDFDDQGFYYSAYDAPTAGQELKALNFYQKVYYHKLGTPQSEDKLIYEDKVNKTYGFGAGVTEDGHYLLINVSEGTERKNRLYYKDLKRGNGKVVKLFDKFDAEYSVIGNDGPDWYVLTDNGAPLKRIVKVNVNKPNGWKTVVPEGKNAIQSASMKGDKIFVDQLQDATTRFTIFSTKGKNLGAVKLPGLGTAGGFGGYRSDPLTYYSFSSYTAPGLIYQYDADSGKSKLYRKPNFKGDLSPYEVKQVFYPSKDGTKIPMFIVSRKDIKLDGNNPTLLYGYGGFDISMTPGFSLRWYAWLSQGGTVAIANLRGGGEYGMAWHDGGRLLNKQNVFDDFAAAGEYLIAQKYTSPAKLAINGGSNGGLLVGATLNQHPDLFAAAIPEVGVMDMLRFHKFTIGWAWKSDYGDPEDAKFFDYLKGYSPYHNAKEGTKYPAVMVMTGDHDDRVFPAHSFKYAAAMQHAQSGDAPILIRIETSAGHGAGTPKAKIIESLADSMAFLRQSLGMN